MYELKYGAHESIVKIQTLTDDDCCMSEHILKVFCKSLDLTQSLCNFCILLQSHDEHSHMSVH